ncbi:hypothetical protein [Streptomyces sp. NBC_01373]|uniref:hypothetical protein n=1 Tax=Streptomyces sp. NBC_01373 TaxID=2903843 RepID=UPI00225B036B|nr:hypothetical protein [Streptomyces sp. NBC_01373]MCX4703882.1 hypothetical protein [Streptomyces sp. NBC_01373]
MKLFTVADGIQDRAAFRAMLVAIGINAHVVPDGDTTTIALDRNGMEQLRAWFAGHGDTAQADAIQRALDEEPAA